MTSTIKPPTDARNLANLRHLYANLTTGAVRDTAGAKRIAEGLLAPVIEAMERGAPSPAGEPVAHKPGCPALGGYGHGIEPCCCGAEPDAQPEAVREPLTPEKILNRPCTGSAPGTIAYDIDLARFVEAAHGIKS